MAGVCGIYEALWLARLHLSSARALYIHIPFCARKCAYCDFSSWATAKGDSLMGEYQRSITMMVEQAREAGLLDGCETAYVGGGTPTLLGPRLAELVAHVRGACTGISELTCEANPESLTDEVLAALPQAGCTRLSIGVQSMNDAELRELGRIHDARSADDRLRAAVAGGFDVSADLMCAIPRQGDKSWAASLERVISAGVGHVSVYPLQIEEGTTLDRRYQDVPTPWNDTEVQARRMELACELLEAAGLARYEVASYAKEGKDCRHNQAYWTAVPYLGLGTSASSMLTREGYERLRSLAPHLPEVESWVSRVRLTCVSEPCDIASAHSLGDLSFELELMSEQQAAAEDLMLGMRMVRGVGPGLLAHARTVLGTAAVDDAFAWCEGRGLCEQRGGSWAPTSAGWLLGNELYGRLWGLSMDFIA